MLVKASLLLFAVPSTVLFFFPFLNFRGSSITLAFDVVSTAFTEVVRLKVTMIDTAKRTEVKTSKSFRTLAVEHLVGFCFAIFTFLMDAIVTAGNRQD